MRVLLISPDLSMGGSELLTTIYAKGLKERGHEVIVAYGFEDGRVPDLADAQIEMIRLSDRQLAGRTLPEWRAALRVAIARFRPDVLHAQSVTAALTVALAAPRLPLLVTIHGIDSSRERLAALVLRAARARVTAVSEASAAGLRRHRLAPDIEVLRTGIDFARLSRAADEQIAQQQIGNPHFCCVARHDPPKGVDRLLLSFADVREALPDARLTLVGSGQDLEFNIRLAAALEVDDVTEFTGEVPNAAPYLRSADITVLASRREGLPIVALESLAVGRPVVATAVGGTPTVVRDGLTGWLVPPSDQAALTRAMVQAGSDLDEARRRGSAGRAMVRESFGVEPVIDQLESLLMQLSTGRADHGSLPIPGGIPPIKPRPYYRGVRVEQKASIVRARSRFGGRPNGGNGVRILCYHRVADEDDVFATSTESFKAQMHAVAQSDAKPIRLDAALDLLVRPLNGRYICVTFDDGFRDNLTNAGPILRELGIPATIFLPTAVPDGTATYYWYRNPPAALNWSEVADLVSDGPFDVQAHSRTHLSLPALDDASAWEEILGSKLDIEHRLSRPATVFSYPSGLYGDREQRMVQEAGYRAAVTTRAGINLGGSSLYELRRTMIRWRDSLDDFEAKMGGLLDQPAFVRQWLERRRARAR